MGKRTKALERLMQNHVDSMKRALRWARNHGAEVDEHELVHVARNTNIRFHIYHANDMIEMGRGYKDPEDKMWSMYSEEDHSFKVANEKVAEFLNHVRNHESIGKGRKTPKIVIDTDISNQFIMHKRLRLDMFDSYEYMYITLTFHIYHIEEDCDVSD